MGVSERSIAHAAITLIWFGSVYHHHLSSDGGGSHADDSHSLQAQSSRDVSSVDDNLLQFTAIPVIYPLVIAGGIGLLMWFVPAPLTAHKPARKKRRSSSRRRRK
ncbi:MAG: hypothetical protein R3C56_09020 [Pirellulaceae bacterium]